MTPTPKDFRILYRRQAEQMKQILIPRSCRNTSTAMARIQVPKKGIFTCNSSTAEEAVQYLRQVSLGCQRSNMSNMSNMHWFEGMLRLTTLGKETLNQCAVNGRWCGMVWSSGLQQENLQAVKEWTLMSIGLVFSLVFFLIVFESNEPWQNSWVINHAFPPPPQVG